MNQHASPDSPDDSQPPGWQRVVVLLSIASLGIGAAVWWQSRPKAADFLRRAQVSLHTSDFEAALTAAEEAIRLGDDRASSRLLAGEAALRLGKRSAALDHFKNVDDDGPESLAARLSSASVMIHQHQIGLAEEQLRRALSIDYESQQVHRLLSDSLGLQGRRWESVPHLLHGISQGDINLQSLCYLADTDRTVELSEEQLAAIVESDDPKCWLGAACVAVAYRKFERAEELLRKAIATSPTLIEAHARLGKILLSQSDESLIAEWNANLPDAAEVFPDIWFIRSQWCLKEKLHEQAAACLYRVLVINSSHSAANHQMAHVLSVLGRPNDAEPFRQRGQSLSRLATLANEVYLGDSRSAKLQEAAELVESLGRFHEAIGWAVAAKFEHPRESWPVAMQQRLEKLLYTASFPIPHSLPAKTLGFAHIIWSPPTASSSKTPGSSINSSPASFRDVTTAAGINFRYENAEDVTTDGRLMFEYTGGGVGVLDYDHDSWPDLYFTQAGALPPFQQQSQATDALYRNLAGRQFVDVSSAAHLQDFGFGQGLAAGDVNNDGFADLYVANIDGNKLYLNLGDGTFEDVTRESGIGHEYWTTSVAIADLNGDSVPDIYDVTFLSDEDVFDRVCEEDGVARSCAPAGFTAADDFVYRGRGNGSFADVSETAGIRVPEGDGLGILIADFAASGTPSIFIANDGRANFYFTQNTTTSGELVFSEDALTRGLAFDRDGRAQACMGIASSDFDDDGNWDLFVTNFFNESNTVYTQFPGEIFGDSSQRSGIREPSLSMLGFGTQAIDGELDGLEDLIVGNGHVDNFEHKDIPYRMPLEYYRNTGKANFTQSPADQSGTVFEQSMLSRSMAIIDWNNDGRAEVAISRLDDPVMLLENTTAKTGNFLAVQIVGTRSSRDSTTARLVATVNNRQIVRQFTAGDGYQSSNQKQVVFGLGADDLVQELLVQWPGGQSQKFTNISAGQKIILREDDPTVWPASTRRSVGHRS